MAPCSGLPLLEVPVPGRPGSSDPGRIPLDDVVDRPAVIGDNQPEVERRAPVTLDLRRQPRRMSGVFEAAANAVSSRRFIRA
jgi:hypothetical protein